MLKDKQGNVWVGTEDEQGLWVYSASSHLWQHHTPYKELSSDIYALACDRAGRVWAGSRNQGVSVWNGREWRNYNSTRGPNGSRTFAIACSPTDGDVWIATENGLSRYSLSKDAWSYYTLSDGLPSDQATSLAFDRKGNIYVGTNCNGLAIGSASSLYRRWTNITGPDSLPNTSGGDDIPSNLINALLVSKSGTIYVGTTAGLARSEDGGKTWRYLRGADWEDKNNQRMNAPKSLHADTLGHIMLEDYITCLAEDAPGRLYVGYRQRGFEIVDPLTGNRLYPHTGDTLDKYVLSILPIGGGNVLIGTYGAGVSHIKWFSAKDTVEDVADTERTTEIPFPSPAQPPTAAALQAMLRQVQSFKPGFAKNQAVYLGEDWQTQGDWVGRYGKQYAMLCAAATPLDQRLTWTAEYDVSGRMGPHHDKDDSLRRFVSWEHTDNPKSLYSPVNGYRTQAEWDDHGEAYPLGTYGGPDIWLTVTLPEGIHRVSLYDMNKDGHDGANRYRDYLADVLPYRDNPLDAEKLSPLAHARIRNFWGGVYEQFVLSGPGKYYIRIGKNNSLNTILAGVFIDKLAGPKIKTDSYPIPFTDGDYQPPDSGVQTREASSKHESTEQPVIQAARRLWAALDGARVSPASYPLQYQYRLLTYRAVVNAGGPEALISNWQWHLHIWTQWDHDTFNHYMASSAQSKLITPNITRSK